MVVRAPSAGSSALGRARLGWGRESHTRTNRQGPRRSRRRIPGCRVALPSRPTVELAAPALYQLFPVARELAESAAPRPGAAGPRGLPRAPRRRQGGQAAAGATAINWPSPPPRVTLPVALHADVYPLLKEYLGGRSGFGPLVAVCREAAWRRPRTPSTSDSDLEVALELQAWRYEAEDEWQRCFWRRAGYSP